MEVILFLIPAKGFSVSWQCYDVKLLCQIVVVQAQAYNFLIGSKTVATLNEKPH